MMKQIALAAVGLSTAAKAHMVIASPEPIKESAPKNPLEADGSNFPCHGISLPSSGGQSMAAGSNQLLSWELAGGANTAVHGGGSCQISITYETNPAKFKDPKNWYVIHSIEKGCPSNTHGNLDDSFAGPDGGAKYTGAFACTDPKTNGVDCVNQFNFTIPKGVKDGHAILAWTWFNSVGNREMYMNCVNADITGGDGSEMAELPSMFVANMASVNQCPTTAYVDVKFPFPGKYVETKTPTGEAASTASTFPLAVPSGTGCDNNGAPVGGVAAALKGSAATTDSAAPTSSAAPTDSAASSADGQNSASITGTTTVTTFATVTASAGDNNKFPPAASTSEAAAAPSDPSPSGSTTGTNHCASGQVPCSTPGSIICVGTSQYAECDIDNCAIPMTLAPGTSCSNGVIMKRSMRHVR